MKRILIYSLATIPLLLPIFYFYNFNNENMFSLKCIFHSITGFWCPGCGGQRAFYLLTHGYLIESLRYNILPPFGLFFFFTSYYKIIGNIFFKIPITTKYKISPNLALVLLGLCLIYGVLRNIPVSPFIYLAPRT